jgi:glycosyltransferase involved in cell wall biosynthesis
MKKLLILAYDFPPYISVGGLRPYSWYKYLKEFDIEPIVITRNWTNEHGNALDYISPSTTDESVIETTNLGTTIRTPFRPTWSNRILLKHGEKKYRFLRRMFTALGEIRQFIHVSGPKRNLYFAAEEYLKNNKVDAIIATGDPFVLFYYASKLGKKFNIPWLADYRDPWSHDKGFQVNVFYHIWNRWNEKKIVSRSRSIITVSEFITSKLKEYFPTKMIHILPNGYDPDVIDRIAAAPQTTEKLTISFVGTIYDWHPWKSFIITFSELIERHGMNIQLNMYGINRMREIDEFVHGLPSKTKNSIRISPRIPNQELLNKLASENVMLLFNNFSFMGTKIFDYIGAKRKIILCYGNDEKSQELKDKYYSIDENENFSKKLQAELINETNSGVVVDNETHLKEVLIGLVDEFNQKGRIECKSIGVENYSRKIQVKKLAEIIKELI